MATTILTEQTLAFASSDGLYLWQTSPCLFTLETGQTYSVTWDGAEYTCVASDMILGDITGVGIGNQAIVGIGEDTGEPFIFGYMPDNDYNACYTSSTEESHTVSITKEVIEDVGIILKDRDGNDGYYYGVKAVKFNTTDGGTVTFNKGEIGTMTVEPDFSEGDMVVIPEDGVLLTEVTVKKPENLLPENITKDVDIAGVVGTHEESSGGSSDIVPSKAINFYNVFGDIVYSYTREEAKALTELPPIPEIDGFDVGWWYMNGGSVSLSTVQECDSFMDIVPRYKISGTTTSVDMIVVDIARTPTTISLNFYYPSYVSINWGDGGGWLTGSGTAQGTISRTYYETGKHIIAFYSSSASNTYLGFKSKTQTNFLGNAISSDRNSGTNGCVIGLFIFSSIRIGQYAIYYLTRLKIAAFANINSYNFYQCPSLEVLIPVSSTNNANYSIYNCENLKRLSVKSNVASQFGALSNLRNFKQTATGTIYSLPISYGLNYIFTAATPPTLNVTFPATYNGYTIYVPDDYVDTYKTSWSSYASYIKPLSEYPDY